MIDIVLTWVDGNDATWRADFEKYNTKKQTDANNKARFRDFGTLKYVFRGIENFMPWINTVHFVTAEHLPLWLNKECRKLNILTHADIFLEKTHLPTFNSSAIEMNFIGIKNLADKFIIFNDDTLVLKDADKEIFFKDELPCDFLIQNPIKGFLAPLLYPNITWVKNISNIIKILDSEFDKSTSIRNNPNTYYNDNYGLMGNLKNFIANFSKHYSFFEHYHQPQPHLKKTWEEIFLKHGRIIQETSSHKFRTSGDITQYIFRYQNLINGNFFPRYAKDFSNFNIYSKRKARLCAKKINDKRFVCINDVPELSEREYYICKKIILNSLEKVLPNKSMFEL
ncbi:MAG: stealth family protein [Patescibacteria group bacterium]